MTGEATAGKGRAKEFDLHTHSTFSDGTCTVRELVAQARQEGLAGIAVTDHDCLAQLSRVRAAARAEGFPVLAGVEVSAFDPSTGRKAHILAFGLEATSDGSGPVERIVAQTLVRRTANTLWQAWTIMRALRADALDLPEEGASVVDPDFSVDAAVREAGESSAVYKQHVMAALCHLPYADARYRQLYKALFKGDGIACRDIPYPSAVSVVRAVREQGGHPVLAHPGQTDSWALIPELVAAGLEGIEVAHPDHGEEFEAMARAAAQRHRLFRTGGSDFHGENGAPPRVGFRRICEEEAGEAAAALFSAETRLG